jgi:hypothetical protein
LGTTETPQFAHCTSEEPDGSEDAATLSAGLSTRLQHTGQYPAPCGITDAPQFWQSTGATVDG